MGGFTFSFRSRSIQSVAGALGTDKSSINRHPNIFI